MHSMDFFVNDFYSYFIAPSSVFRFFPPATALWLYVKRDTAEALLFRIPLFSHYEKQKIL